jgi:hypothetical protein
MNWTVGLREQIEADRAEEEKWLQQMKPLIDTLDKLDPDGWDEWWNGIDEHATRSEIHDAVVGRIVELSERNPTRTTVPISTVSLPGKAVPVRTLEEPKP